MYRVNITAFLILQNIYNYTHYITVIGMTPYKDYTCSLDIWEDMAISHIDMDSHANLL